ncbi:MAG: fibronectin type III domain-containing protein [Bergeyella sp.]
MSKINRLLKFVYLLVGVSILFSCQEERFADEMAVPTDISTVTTGKTMSFYWSPVEGATSYLYEFREQGGEIISGEVSEPIWSIDGINPQGKYEFRVKAVNKTTNRQSLWSEWGVFDITQAEVAFQFNSGSGTEDDPYIIKTAGELALLASVVNHEVRGYSEYGVYYKLEANIDLKNYSKWEPIGIGVGSTIIGTAQPTLKSAFRGNFNGNGFTVSNLQVDMTADEAEAYAGLFGLNVGWIKNVNVSGTINATSNYTGGGNLAAGGVVGLSSIGYDSNNQILAYTGGLVGNSFTGSVIANSGADTNGTAVAGGICGYALSGNIDNSTVVIESAKSIHAISGISPAAGGVVAVQQAGRLSVADVTVAGNILAEFTHTDNESTPAIAGGVLGYCGRLQGLDNNPGVQYCNINVSGTIKAVASGDYCPSTAGALAGYSNFDMALACNAEISGSILAEGEDAIFAGGLIGGMLYGNGGANSLNNSNVVIKSSGLVSGKQTASSVVSLSSGTYVGGMVGGLGNNAPGVLVTCSVVSDGKIYASNASTGSHATACGGVIGMSSTSVGSSCVMGSNAVLEASGKVLYVGGVSGGFRGTYSKQFIGNYAVIDGKIKTSYASGAYTANIGGLSGFINGLRVGTVWQTAPVKGCYSVFRGTIENESSGTVTIGAISGLVTRGVFTNNYWWSTTAGMPAVAGDSPSGVTQFSSITESGFNEAKEVMNPTLTENNYLRQYVYDSSKGYLILL